MSITARSSLSSVALQVGDALRRHGIRAVLTGGACASLHSAGAFYSVDMDFILLGHVTRAALDAAMGSVGFKRTGDRYLHARARFYVEFPRGPLAIGSDYRIKPVERRLGRARALVLSPTDSCRDRLAAFYHWNDRQSLAVAVSIALRNRVNLAAIRRWSITEGAERRFDEFLAELRAARRKRSRRIPAGKRSGEEGSSMKRLALGLVLVLAVSLRLLPTASWAGSVLSIAVVGGKLTVAASGAAVGPAAAGALILSASRRMGDFEAGAPSGRTYLIVDATPPEAQVFLDGRLLGTARQLVARAFPLPPGRHAVEIVAPGFRPYIAQFVSAAGSFPIRIRLALVPE